MQVGLRRPPFLSSLLTLTKLYVLALVWCPFHFHLILFFIFSRNTLLVQGRWGGFQTQDTWVHVTGHVSGVKWKDKSFLCVVILLNLGNANYFCGKYTPLTCGSSNSCRLSKMLRGHFYGCTVLLWNGIKSKLASQRQNSVSPLHVPVKCLVCVYLLLQLASACPAAWRSVFMECIHITSLAAIIGVRKQWDDGHVGLPRKSCESWTLFLCKYFLLFLWICIEAGQLSEYALFF